MWDSVRIYCIAFFVPLSGIYWLPGIPPETVSVTKAVVFCGLAFLGALKLFTFSWRTLTFLALLLLGAMMTFIALSFTSSAQTALGEARNYIEPMLWLVALSGVPRVQRPALIRALTRSMAILVIFALYPIIAQIGILPDYSTPTGLYAGQGIESEWLLRSSSVTNSGFSGARTGWALTVATGGLLAASLIMQRSQTHTLSTATALTILLIALMGIAVTGARGGIVGLLAGSAFWLVSGRNRLLPTALTVFAILIVALLVDVRELVPSNLLRGFDTGGALGDRLNSMTTNRFDTYTEALRLWGEAPLIGVGPNDARIAVSASSNLVQIHNLWLRVAAEGGILALLPLFLLTYRLLGLALTRHSLDRASTDHTRESITWPNTRPVILCATVMALAEPNVLIGSFNANAILWTAVWLALEAPRPRLRPQQRTSPLDHQVDRRAMPAR
ncbi:MAG: O-antigen ligase family protein [Hyphomonadaceae bacterium]